MRLLTATARTQGMRADDYCEAVLGELVWLPDPCLSALLRPADPPCACHRTFAGVVSGAGTTTALVVETDLSRREVVELVGRGAEANGWPPSCAGHLSDAMLAIARRWPTGTVLERAFDQFRARWAP